MPDAKSIGPLFSGSALRSLRSLRVEPRRGNARCEEHRAFFVLIVARTSLNVARMA
jgi:hypothetical protein